MNELVIYILDNQYLKKVLMSKNNSWMMMTYYCPTHGSIDRSEPIEITRNDLKNAKLKLNKNKKLIN